VIKIGAHALANAVLVAPMAGITDRPFRRLARRFGAALAVSEMVSARPELRGSRKTRLRLDHAGEPGPISVQIAGADPAQLAEAARHNVALGAEIIDINMGCPAKKVCNAYAGSALLADEALVARILEAVVAAVPVPVTLKIRTGPSPAQRNAVRIARIAEAEYETIAEVKCAVAIPVIANGDIRTPHEARRALERSGADGVMIGRAAHGRPWLYGAIARYLSSGELAPPPPPREIGRLLIEHLDGLYDLYGHEQGARVARKHIGWTVRDLPGGEALRAAVNVIGVAEAQRAAVNDYFERIAA
jgi:tRNA-dihydrouridine synthase B